MSSRLAIFCALMPLALGGAALWACASPPDASRATAVGFVDPNGQLDPDPVQFKERQVSRFLERRCGTLDCHGQPERPLRIYGDRGLRLPNDRGLRPGRGPSIDGVDGGIDGGDGGIGGGTTDEEVVANYRSVVGLEPEVTSRVVAAHAQGTCGLPGEPEDVPCARRLLLVSKPLGCNTNSSVGCNGTAPGVEHKGGAVIAPNDDGYDCIVTWLEGSADREACQRAINAY